MRETVGLTMMEAMLAGCVPIVANNGGPRFAVSDDCGYRIAVGTASQMIEGIANTIVEIDRDRKIIADKGQRASKRIATYYTEENYRETVNAIYLSVTKRVKP
jgi:glycosyltransferase involved in cell wall biosynthesis